MSKKGKVILVTTVTTTALATVTAVATVIICRKIYEKNYFSAN